MSQRVDGNEFDVPDAPGEPDFSRRAIALVERTVGEVPAGEPVVAGALSLAAASLREARWFVGDRAGRRLALADAGRHLEAAAEQTRYEDVSCGARDAWQLVVAANGGELP